MAILSGRTLLQSADSSPTKRRGLRSKDSGITILIDQSKRLVAYNCGIRSEAYRRIINEDGQRKLGSPRLVCFKSCIAR